MKTRLITTTAGARMIARAELHKPTHHRTEAQRLVATDTPAKLAARPVLPAAATPTVIRSKSDWGDSAKADRRGRDAAAARAEARREAAPRKPIKAIIG